MWTLATDGSLLLMPLEMMQSSSVVVKVNYFEWTASVRATARKSQLDLQMTSDAVIIIVEAAFAVVRVASFCFGASEI